MPRLLSALLLAVGCHTLLFVLPAPWSNEAPPVILGEEQITLKLAATADGSADSAAGENSSKQMQDAAPSPPLEQKPEQAAAPPSNTEEPQHPAIEAAASTPVQAATKVADPAVLKTDSRKIKKIIHTAAPPEPSQVRHNGQAANTVTTQSDRSGHISQPSGQPGKTSTTVEARPMYHQNRKPTYPQLARKRNWQGVVMLAVRVSEQGAVEKIRIQKTSGYDLLDSAALTAVKKWKFLPGMKDGVKTVMEIIVPVHFVLQ